MFKYAFTSTGLKLLLCAGDPFTVMTTTLTCVYGGGLCCHCGVPCSSSLCFSFSSLDCGCVMGCVAGAGSLCPALRQNEDMKNMSMQKHETKMQIAETNRSKEINRKKKKKPIPAADLKKIKKSGTILCSCHTECLEEKRKIRWKGRRQVTHAFLHLIMGYPP